MKRIFFILAILLSTNIYAQNDSTDFNKQITDTAITIGNFGLPDTVVQAYNNNVSALHATEENLKLQNDLLIQKLLKNLFLTGFIFMTILVIFLFYINHSKIKKIAETVKIQERQMEVRNFEVEKLSIVLNNTMDGIAIIDLNNNILWNNNSFLELYGITDDNLRDKRIDFFSSDNEQIQELINKAKNEKTPVQFTFEAKNKNGHTIYIQRRIIPLTNEKENIENFAIIDTDYTALKLATENTKK